MPTEAIYVGRPSKWGNPWEPGSVRIGSQPDGKPWTLDDVLRWYRQYARQQPPEWSAPLRGRDLVCWCPLKQPCHADFLLELAS